MIKVSFTHPANMDVLIIRPHMVITTIPPPFLIAIPSVQVHMHHYLIVIVIRSHNAQFAINEIKHAHRAHVATPIFVMIAYKDTPKDATNVALKSAV